MACSSPPPAHSAPPLRSCPPPVHPAPPLVCSGPAEAAAGSAGPVTSAARAAIQSLTSTHASWECTCGWTPPSCSASVRRSPSRSAAARRTNAASHRSPSTHVYTVSHTSSVGSGKGLGAAGAGSGGSVHASGRSCCSCCATSPPNRSATRTPSASGSSGTASARTWPAGARAAARLSAILAARPCTS